MPSTSCAGRPLPHFLPVDSSLHGATPAEGHAGHGMAYPESRTVTHLHEHLGQLIAYARVNNVVPPWSK